MFLLSAHQDCDQAQPAKWSFRGKDKLLAVMRMANSMPEERDLTYERKLLSLQSQDFGHFIGANPKIPCSKNDIVVSQKA